MPDPSPGNLLRVASGSFAYETGIEHEVATELYDGAMLLGTDVVTARRPIGASQLLGVFASPSSPWTSGEPTRVDFTGITDGTIDGRVRIRTTSGIPWRIESDSIGLRLIRASGPAFGSVPAEQAVISSISVVPEVRPFGLLLCAVLGGLAWKRGRRAVVVRAGRSGRARRA